jgi:hypothetical protein
LFAMPTARCLWRVGVFYVDLEAIEPASKMIPLPCCCEQSGDRS